MKKEYPKSREEFEKYLLYRRLIRGKQTKKPISPSSIHLYWSVVKTMLNHLNTENPSAEQIQTYYETVLLPQTKKKNSLTATCVGLNHYCNMKGLEFNLPYHASQEVEKDIWTEKEHDALINEPKKLNDLLCYSLFRVFNETAQRQVDVRGLDLKNIDSDNRQVTMFINKLDIWYTFNISAETLSAIAVYVAKQRIEPKNDKDAVWTSKQGRVGYGWLLYRISYYASMVGITKKSTPHTFRHYTINKTSESGVSFKTVMRMYCIMTVKTLERYLHPTKESIRKHFDDLHNESGKSRKSTSKGAVNAPIVSSAERRGHPASRDDSPAMHLAKLFDAGLMNETEVAEKLSKLKNNADLSYIG